MNNRIVRVREMLKRELGALFTRDMTFENALVTINSVDLTPDLKNGRVFVGILGDEDAQAAAMKKIRARSGMLQKRLAARVVLKYTPHLEFEQDDSVERGVKVVQLLDEIEIPEDDEESKP